MERTFLIIYEKGSFLLRTSFKSFDNNLSVQFSTLYKIFYILFLDSYKM